MRSGCGYVKYVHMYVCLIRMCALRLASSIFDRHLNQLCKNHYAIRIRKYFGENTDIFHEIVNYVGKFKIEKFYYDIALHMTTFEVMPLFKSYIELYIRLLTAI